MNKFTLVDQTQREQALNPEQSYIVQAPAGSGKTELLTQRYLVLLAQACGHPEEIICITFTRKAAHEMKSRVVAALEKAASQSRPQITQQQKTWDLAQAVLKKDQQMQWGILKNPARLRIQTFDALCAALTRQMPLLSKFGAEMPVSDATQTLYQQATIELIKQLEQDTPWSAAIASLLQHLDNQYASAEKMISNMLARREQWLPYIIQANGDQALRSYLETNLQTVILEKAQRVYQAIAPDIRSELQALSHFAGANLQASASQSPIISCLTVDFNQAPTLETVPAWQGLAHLLLNQQGQWRRSINKSLGFPAPSSCRDKEQKTIYQTNKEKIQTIIENLSQQTDLDLYFADLLASPSAQYTESQWHFLTALLQLLPVAAAQLQLQFQVQHQVDFAAISMAAIQALGDIDNPSDLALRLDYQIKHLLIDEFQDTSSSQFRLLERLTAGWQVDDGRSLFIVGDPMQSIYRFREAEVGLFLRAQQQGIGQVSLQSLQLKTNFRSRQKIVDWVNQTFSQVFPSQQDISSGAVSYSPSVAIHDNDDQTEIQCHILTDAESEQQAQKIIATLLELKNKDPQASIAILVKARRHLQYIIPLCQTAKIPYQAVEIETLGMRSTIQDLLALTKALLRPGDRLAWLTILRAPWCGLNLTDLHQISHACHEQPLWQQILNCLQQNTLSSDGQKRLSQFVQVLSHSLLQRQRLPLREWIEATWLALGGPACLNQQESLNLVDLYFTVLEQNDENGDILNLETFTDTVANFYVPNPTVEANSIQIMTIHKAKGLEFDYVLLPELQKSSRADEQQLLLWMQRLNQRGIDDLIFAPIYSSREQDKRTYQFLRREEAKKSNYELARLLYVAVTRAKKGLHLFACVTSNPYDTTSVKSPSSSSLLAPIWFYAKNHLSSVDADLFDIEQPHPQQLKRLHTNWINPIYSPTVDFLQQQNTHTKFDWKIQTQRLVGTFIHEILQQFAQSPHQLVSKASLEQLEPQWRVRLCQLGIVKSELDNNLQLVKKIIRQFMQDARGQWILSSRHTQAHNEYALSSYIDNEICHSIIDRTFIDENNTRWIIDYKTSHTTGNIEQFLNQEQARYKTQLEYYGKIMATQETRPIKLGLYFPMLPAWREWFYDESALEKT